MVMQPERPSWKGQSSLEFLMVVGIALAITAPFVISAQRSVMNVQSTSNAVQIQRSLDRLAEAVSTVSVSGEPARRTFMMELPDNTQKGYIVQDRAVVYTLKTRAGLANVTRVFETNISAVDGGIPQKPGGTEVTVYAWNGQVNISKVG